MDYTREPIIESVITAREGCKLVIRSSKGMSQEEYFMDAVEVVTFGKAQFFRSLEKPKPFLLPINDYEVVEVREPRMVLKNVGSDRSIKIGQEKKVQQPKPQQQERLPEPEGVSDERLEDKKRGGKRSDRRRRGNKPQTESETVEAKATSDEDNGLVSVPSPSAMSALLAPPTTLISETLTRYRRDEAFKQAFYEKDEEVDAIIPQAIPTDEDFDEGDHVLFRGHEAVTDFKASEERETEFLPKEEVPYNEEPL